jgi:hypothetical protein
METTAVAVPLRSPVFANASVKAVIGIISMVMIANLQYGWTFLVPDIQKSSGGQPVTWQPVLALTAG